MSEKPLEYYAQQHVPDDWADTPDLIANMIIGRVEYLMLRVLEDGHNPLDGDLTVFSLTYPPGDRKLRFVWAQHE